MKDLVLTGFMGTGKSTVARILGERLGRTVIDTDAEIERRTGRSIVDVFADWGEAAFRDIESETLAGLGEGRGRVIATGAGALVQPGNLDVVRGSAVVCLTADPVALQERLSSARDRPLLRDSSQFFTLLAQREEAYARFPQVDTTDRDPEDIADEVARIAGLPVAHFTFPAGSESTITLENAGLERAGEILRDMGVSGNVLLVSDENLDALGWRSVARDALRAAGFQVHESILPPGEEHKSLLDLDDLYADCLEAKLDRSDTIVALGGGVVCDLAGMLAATYMRGIRLVLLPTTLLAQIDAAIGGKTAVDAHGVKNIAGSFHPAEMVLIDPEVLSTLPVALLSEGLAETVKIAAMRSESLFRQLESLGGPGDIVDRPEILWAAARLKAEIIREDPLERGIRALLNFGHTVGHGLEAAAGFRESHGRCVAAGMVAESRVSERGGFRSGRLLSLLEVFRLPVVLPQVDTDAAYSAALHDKKRRGAAVRVAVPDVIGRGVLETWSHEQLRRGIEFGVGRPA
jgi:3-dehydroquinate synthetase/broad-specificity NMP kinase